jgi:glycosyltransferase involved in cell wall biosynthesis
MILEIAVQSLKFNNRLCWMLSSILQQEPKCPVVVSLAYLEKNGVEEIIEIFQKAGLKIKQYKYSTFEEFAKRSRTRNCQVEHSTADWIMFADSDMVYPRDFFSKLFPVLQSDRYKDSPHCLYLQRYSNELEDINPLMEKEAYPGIITDAADKLSKVPLRKCSNRGAGYCQIAKVSKLEKSYVPEDMGVDGPLCRFRADKIFRKRLGAYPLEGDIPLQMHMQHVRGDDTVMK